MIKKIVIIILIALSIGLFMIYNIRPSLNVDDVYEEAKPINLMSEPAFIESSRSAIGYDLISENNFLKLYLNTNTTQFAVVDKRNDFIWYSSVFTSDSSASKTYSNLQKSTVALRYLQKDNTTRIMSNYEFSIANKQFEIDYDRIENGVQINYTIGDNSPKGYWFPTKISKERFDRLVLTPFYQHTFDDPIYQQELARYIRNAYVISEDDPETYLLALVTGDKTSSDLVGTDISYLFEILYEIGNYGNLQNEFGEYIEEYTLNDVEIDNETYGYELNIEDPEFMVPLVISLESDRLDVYINTDEITYKEPYEIISIDLLPYMGAQNQDKQGYMVVPEGSGGLMYFNNGKVKQRSYISSIYGDDQLTIPNELLIEDVGAKMPIYGIKTDQNALLSVINNGEEHAQIIAEVSGKNDRFNKVYPRFTFKDQGLYYLTQQGITIWNEQRYDIKPSLSYYFLNDDQANYTSMAHLYGEYLRQKYQMQVLSDQNQKLYLDVLGSYDYEDYFLFVPYKNVEALTTYEQAKMIVDELMLEGVDDMVINYKGWFNQGINHEYADHINLDQSLGKKKDLESFYQEMILLGHDVYFDVDFMTLYDRPMLFKDQLISRVIGGTLAEYYPYDIASRLPDRTKDPMYNLNVQSINQQLNGFMKDFNKIDIQGISFRQLGSSLYSDFNRKDGIYRYELRDMYQDMMMDVKDQTQILLSKPNDYMLPFASHIADMDIYTSQFLMVDEAIPFMQLALSKYKDFSMPSVNIDQIYDINYYILKAIETGSNMKFTVSYEDSSVLIDTKYNSYFSITYNKVKDDIVYAYQSVNDLIGNHYIISHEKDIDGFVHVTYDHGLVIKLDYDTLSFEIIN